MTVVEHAAHFFEDAIEPLDEISDRTPPVIKEGWVRLPASFVAAYRDYYDNGWPSLSADDVGWIRGCLQKQ
ncbi:hypothetical protein [Chromohalobacter israelensis]|uniref:hypothetical protein n=1 Tax=Chromohalobacter israelensis TaxID=141390 RepID=UPI001CC4E967|nr:hypothetical protein [Chromohalobacter salexigens]MBZ5876247.1 hypothetical protein [Chromohalobacter salexigens]